MLTHLEPINQVEGSAPDQLTQRVPNQRYVIQRYETLLDIWQRHASSMTWTEFMRWNALGKDSRPVAGQTLFIRA